MLIKVKYENNRFDLIKGEMLDRFLAEGRVRQFFRYSEDKWVTVGRDPMRKGGHVYGGTERRGMALRKTGAQ